MRGNRLVGLAGLLVSTALVFAQDVVPGRYIIELTGDPAISALKGREREAALRAPRAIVQARQRALTLLLRQRNVQVLHSVDTVANALIVHSPDADAAALAGLPNVRKVYPVRLARMMLDRAIVLQKVPTVCVAADPSESRQERIKRCRAGLPDLPNAGKGVKIAIIDSGIDPNQPGLQDETLQIPDGYPRASSDADLKFTNSKVIVARTYDPTTTALDVDGHGTGVAMVAAGNYIDGPRGIMSGVAPKAFVGNYRANTGLNGLFSTDNILRAFDDAVKDGMDVINLSAGIPGLTHAADDLLAEPIARVTAAGIVVVLAAGNTGPDLVTINGFCSAPEAVCVGASESDRIPHNPAVTLGGGQRFNSVPATNSETVTPIAAGLLDVAVLDGDGFACMPFPANSLDGRIAFVLRGGACNFEEKMNNAQSGGAVAILVATDSSRPDPGSMAAGANTLPGEMVGFADGSAIRRLLGAGPVTATLRFYNTPINPNETADFSSRGPTVDLEIRPDLLAVGDYVLTETPVGIVIEAGTSFAAPMVAGAAAVLRAARPDLTVSRIRSLLINSASPMVVDGKPSPVQHAGAGLLNLTAALESTVVFQPASMSFSSPTAGRDLSLTNLGAVADTFDLTVASADVVLPMLSEWCVALEPGETKTVTLAWPDGEAEPGEYQGFVTVKSSSTSVESRVPYWRAVRSTLPAFISIANATVIGPPGSTAMVFFRVTDSAGISLTDPAPAISVVQGNGQVLQIELLGDTYPGAYLARLRLGAARGDNIFRITAGPLGRDLTIIGSN